MKLVSIHKLVLLTILTMALTQSNAQEWSLKQCIDTAQVHNASLQIDRNSIALSEQKHKEAKANLIPKVTANGDYRYFTNLPYQLLPLSALNPAAPDGEFREAQFGVPHNINANLQLSIPLYNPKAYGAIQSTQIATALSELKKQKTEEQTYYEISNLYYNAQILHHQRAFVDSNLSNSKKLLENLQLLKNQSLAIGNDVNKVQLQVTQLTSQKENINSKYQQVLNVLKFMMGIAPDYDLEIETNIVYSEFANQESNPALDLEILKTQNRLLLSEQKTLFKSRYLPTANLFASYGTTGFGYNQEPNSFLNFYPIGFAGIQLSYTLFDGTVARRKSHQKEIELKNNELQFQQRSAQISMETENARLQKSVAQLTAETAKEQIKLAQSVYEQTLLQQRQGVAGLTDVLLADNDLRETQQSYLNAVVEFLKAELELKKLTNQLKIGE